MRILILGSILALALVAPTRAQQPDLHRAGLVVVHGDGSLFSTCVAFSERSITGVELLRRSGLEIALDAHGGLGYGVCAIGEEGCPAGQDCFCQCRSSPCAYWVYSHRMPDGSWAISGVGASGWQVRDGDVDGWVWGDGSIAPPKVVLDQICPSDAAPPAALTAVPPTPSPTLTSGPDPTITLVPLSAPLTPTAAPRVQVETPGFAGSPFGYAFFGIAVLGLACWLIFAGTRRYM